jgi:aldehyde:ferredoxin oxidoreductase
MRWFNEPLTEGASKGAKLDLEKYNVMLDAYYAKKGWDQMGVPKQSTMERLGLSQEARQIEEYHNSS